MIEFWIADLKSDEKKFSIPTIIGTWEFRRKDDYDVILSSVQEGQCSITYCASNEKITHNISNRDFTVVTGELINICLILSFITAACVTPKGTTSQSDVGFLKLGDLFIRPRSITGFPSLPINCSYNDFFSKGFTDLTNSFQSRRLRLFLSHWISGLTCFSLEDLFLSIAVQMDIIKQCEIDATKEELTYRGGMILASLRYGIKPIANDYVKMRNDIVHEGVLSGSKFKNKNKKQCAKVVAASLNWIDRYISAVLNIGIISTSVSRWKAEHFEYRLPALSPLRV